jgi:flavin reductase (DIM6/NTAB) family NADH-FMN oxidoreductase RutF
VIGADEFRRVLSHFASGVTILTTRGADGRPVGLTASAFTSVSLEPPLVLACVDLKARCYEAFEAAGHFAVNVLGAHQEHLSRRFASAALDDKFDGLVHTPGALGVPLIEGALAHIECAKVAAYPAGDHTILVGRVEASAVGDGHPLLYYRGRYDRLCSTADGQGRTR